MINELLCRYVADQSESAFGELVRQHIDLVYSAALRQVDGDVLTAQDVTQAVFTDLARRAARLARHTSLVGWLYTSTRYQAAKARRGEQRRRAREHAAYEMNRLLYSLDPDPVWQELRPLLDEVMHELNKADREAVLMRFFQHLPLAEVGAHLGLSENTARMKVERALEKLRVALARRGVTSTLAALTGFLSEGAVGAVPQGLVVQIAHASFAAAAGGVGWHLGWLRLTASMKAKVWLVVAATVLLLGLLLAPLFATGRWEKRPRSSLRSAPITDGPIQPSAPTDIAASLPATDRAATTNRLLLRIITSDSGKAVPSVFIDYRLLERTNRTHLQLWASRFGVCEVPVPRDTVRNLLLWTKIDGFADTWLNWRLDRGDQIPLEYTLRLDRAVEIGGLVLNEDHQPVTGAQVGFGTSTDPAIERARPETHAVNGFVTTTDQQGRWSLARIAPAVLRQLQGAASHPEYVRSQVALASNPEIERQLLARTYAFELGLGFMVRGAVVDTEGLPVPSAALELFHASAGTEPIGDIARSSRRVTNSLDGAFVIRGTMPGKSRLRVEADGFVPKEMDFELDSNTAPLRVKLEHGYPFRLKVVDQQGRPVPSAGVEFNLATGRVLRHTDAEGRLVWVGATKGELTFAVRADGYLWQSDIKMKADGLEHIVPLSPGLTISGSVRDLATGKPITHFRIIPGWPQLMFGATNVQWQSTGRIPWVDSKDGAFKQVVHEAISADTSLVFKFQADGYVPAVSREVRTSEGEARLDIGMRGGASTTVTVTLPDGRPAGHVDIGLVYQGARLRLRPGGLARGNNYPQGASVATTDERGQFVLSPDDSLTSIIAAASEGYAQVSLTGLAQDPTIRLEAWGRIEGTFLSGGHPAPDRVLRFEYGASRPNTLSTDVEAYRVATDGEGRFAFPLVPPGKHRLIQVLSGGHMSDGTLFLRSAPLADVEVAPGQTTTVTIGASNYTVTARLRWPAGFAPNQSWNLSINLQAQRAPPTAAAQTGAETLTSRHFSPMLRQIPFAPSADGTWVADNVPAGNYSVRAEAHDQPDPGSGALPQRRAGARMPLVIPGDAPAVTLDLGEILMKPDP